MLHHPGAWTADKELVCAVERGCGSHRQRLAGGAVGARAAALAVVAVRIGLRGSASEHTGSTHQTDAKMELPAYIGCTLCTAMIRVADGSGTGHCLMWPTVHALALQRCHLKQYRCKHELQTSQ